MGGGGLRSPLSQSFLVLVRGVPRVSAFVPNRKKAQNRKKENWRGRGTGGIDDEIFEKKREHDMQE